MRTAPWVWGDQSRDDAAPGARPCQPATVYGKLIVETRRSRNRLRVSVGLVPQAGRVRLLSIDFVPPPAVGAIWSRNLNVGAASARAASQAFP
jgi:hypothetical protein